MTIKIKFNGYDNVSPMKVKVSDEATLSEAIDSYSAVLKQAGYVFKELAVVRNSDVFDNFDWDVADTYLEDGAIYPRTDIDHVGSDWDSRISVYGNNEDDSRQLAERVVYLLKTYGAD